MKRSIYPYKSSQGQSLIEVIVAMAIFSLISVSLVSMILGGLALLSEGGSLTAASALAEEGMEAVRAIKNRSWNELSIAQSAVTASPEAWDFVGEGSSEQIGEFTRLIRLYPVYRDTQRSLVDESDPAAVLDPGSKRVEVVLSWQNNRGSVNTKTWNTLLTNWDSSDWIQDDWSGGAGETIWTDAAMFELDDGNIDSSNPGTVSLLEISTSSFATSGYLESAAFFAGAAKAYNFIYWTENMMPECISCAVRLQIKTAEDESGNPVNWSETWCGPDGEDGDEDDYYTDPEGEPISLDHNLDGWVKYRLTLEGEPEYSPIVESVGINFQH